MLLDDYSMIQYYYLFCYFLMLICSMCYVNVLMLFIIVKKSHCLLYSQTNCLLLEQEDTRMLLLHLQKYRGDTVFGL